MISEEEDDDDEDVPCEEETPTEVGKRNRKNRVEDDDEEEEEDEEEEDVEEEEEEIIEEEEEVETVSKTTNGKDNAKLVGELTEAPRGRVPSMSEELSRKTVETEGSEKEILQSMMDGENGKKTLSSVLSPNSKSDDDIIKSMTMDAAETGDITVCSIVIKNDNEWLFKGKEMWAYLLWGLLILLGKLF